MARRKQSSNGVRAGDATSNGSTPEPVAHERADDPGTGSADRPDPEVPAKAKRRKYTAEYKRKILKEADRCSAPGETGALLRREGLYSSLLVTWRRQRDRGELRGLSPRKRGRKPDPDKQANREIEKLRRENARLQKNLEQAELIIEIQKKVSRLMGESIEPESNGRS